MPKLTMLPVASNVGASDIIVIVQGNITKRAAVSLLSANGNIDGNVGNLTVNGILTVIGNSNLSANANVGGNLTVFGNGNTVGNQVVGGALTVTGNANLQANATVGGNLTVTGNQTLAGNANFSGTLTVAGNANLGANANVGGNLTVLGTSNISGNERVGGILTVVGNANLQSNANLAGNFVVSTGNITATTGFIRPNAGNGIIGTTSNDSVAAGSVGEYVESVISASVNFPTSGQYGDLTSISLTAGDWDVSGIWVSIANGATLTGWGTGISTTAGDSTTGLTYPTNRADALVPVGTISATISIPVFRMSLAATTTVYLKYTATYSVATPKCFGRLSARRVR